MARAWLGTSGFSYKEWKPSFYPENLPDKRFLQYYCTRLNSVEIDYTFYRMPTPQTIEGWKSATPDGFRFAIKASQKITHRERLKLPSEALDYFLRVVPGLGDRLGVILFQLPPFFHCDLGRLEQFVSALPEGIRAVFEFRHESWFVEDVFRLLEEHRVALCINDSDEQTTPLRLTAGFTYLRLRRTHYSPEQRREWTARMRDWVEEGRDVFAYIKHEANPDAPLIAVEFAKEL